MLTPSAVVQDACGTSTHCGGEVCVGRQDTVNRCFRVMVQRYAPARCRMLCWMQCRTQRHMRCWMRSQMSSAVRCA
eukprot:3083374-Rhodomonas_salina.1